MAEPISLTDTAPQTARLDPSLRVKLSLMMFLQYAIWGAWYSVLSIYLGHIDFTPAQIGNVYGTVALASIFSPLVFGQIADKWVPTQYLLAALHLVGSVFLVLASRTTEYVPLYTAILLYSLLYIPTLSLTNALSFHHIPDAARQFPAIRVFGTIGWIVIGLVVGWTLNQRSSQPLLLGAALSVVTGLYCLTLPHTPPKGKSGDALPFLKAFGLLREGAFTLFLIISFVIAVILAGYFTFTGQFLDNIGIQKVAAVMTIGQVAEMVLLPLLPYFLKTIGMKWTLVMGMAAWGLRYGAFSLGHPLGLVVASIALHGVCYDFFFVAGYIHVDNKASGDMRASAQALFNLVVMGLGMFLGNIVFGQLVGRFQRPQGVDWRYVWGYPAAAVMVALLIFALGFREKKNTSAERDNGRV